MDQKRSLKLATRQRFEMMPAIPRRPAIRIGYQPCSLLFRNCLRESPRNWTKASPHCFGVAWHLRNQDAIDYNTECFSFSVTKWRATMEF